jgi:uncharacterized membrane protein
VSIGFGLALVRSPVDLVSFVASNQIGDFPRRDILIQMLTGAGLGIALGMTGQLLLTVRRCPNPSARLQNAARRLTPLALVGFLPLLFHWELWTDRDLDFLVLVACFTLAAWSSFRTALSSPPLLETLQPSAWPPALERMARNLGARWTALRSLDWRWLPGALVGLATVGYAVLFSVYTVTFHWNLHTAAFDLGLFDNLTWNLLHGNGFFRATPYNGPGGTHFGNHANLIAYLVAPLYALRQSADMLLILQSIWIAAAAVPLFLFARRHLGPWPACLIALCYLLYPPVHGANLYEFHFVPMAAFFFFSALYFLEEKRDWLAAIAVVLALAVREDVGAGIAVIGAFLLLTGRRPRAGFLLAVVGALQVLVLKQIVMPRFQNGAVTFTYMYKGLLPQGKEGFGPLLETVIGNPAFTLGTLLDRSKLLYLLQLFVPLAFLPLKRPIILLLMVPGFFFTLLSTGYMPLIQISFQYTVHWAPFLFIGLVTALESPSADAADPRPAITRRRVALAALVCAMIPVSYQFGAIFQRHTARGGFSAYRFETTPEDLQNRAALQKLLRHLPPRASIAATDNLLPQVSNRPATYTLHYAVYDAEYLLFWTSRTRNWAPEVERILPELTAGSFGVVAVEEPFVLARRGEPPVLNNQFLERWGERMITPAAHAPPVIVVPGPGP